MSVDFPRAWEIARSVPAEDHDPRCSYAQTSGALLCDCHVLTSHPEYASVRQAIPGWEGSIGPGPGQYGKPHVYARDVCSGAGNCVCGRSLGSSLHVQAAPGVPVPDSMRT